MKVLITGGAGFIGTHLARRLVREKVEVSVLDNFSPQVHGSIRELPPDLSSKVILHTGDLRDRGVLLHALRGQNVVVHLAAETGTGQSMYEVSRYEAVNIGGTANLMHLLVNDPSRTVTKLIVASSRAVYGEASIIVIVTALFSLVAGEWKICALVSMSPDVLIAGSPARRCRPARIVPSTRPPSMA